MKSLEEFVACNQRLLAITGAGCSVSSGIPTYRSVDGEWLGNTPIEHRHFMNQLSSRQRYWARSFVAWPSVAMAKPNSAHLHLAALESRGIVRLLVTQNVDRLHQSAGHKNVIDLHGRLDQVICLCCNHVSSRAELQDRLVDLNPCLQRHESRRKPDQQSGDEKVQQVPPDVDTFISEAIIKTFKVPNCEKCDGILKPNVVFFGGTIVKQMVSQVYQQLNEVDGLLLVGTSLQVFSGYRFCKRAFESGKPIASINPGRTRGDEMLSLHVNEDCTTALARLMGSLAPRST